MKIRNKTRRCVALLLAASLLLSLAACGGNGTEAVTMHLMRTEGEVGVSDDAGKSVTPMDNLGLYSGYGVNTRSASYAWINLDDVKLTKMDQDSEIAIQKDGKHLEIEVKSGSLFFNVTEPLEEDETMDIRTSTMLVGIRGTCGWVEDNGGFSRVYLLEGKVECSAGEQTVQVNAGEFAELTADGELVVEPFTARDVPAFVVDEVADDPGLSAEILEASGLDVSSASDEQGELSEEEAGELAASGAPDGQEELNEEEAGELVASGEWGEAITWSLRGNTLFVRGTGVTPSPDEIDDHYDLPWYDYSEQIHTVIIGDGITGIGMRAFYKCSNLTSVSIPNSVTDLQNFAFSHCSSLTSVVIPEGVPTIGHRAFDQCSSLTSVTIPNSVTNIQSFAFSNCSSLTGVTIPAGVTQIGSYAFNYCSSLTSITIPAGVTSIESAVFFDCSSLTSVTIPAGVTSIDKQAFYGCSSLTNVYYGGSASQWEQIDIGDFNDPLFNATIHYNSTGN